MRRTHDITIRPLNHEPPAGPDLVCRTQAEAIRLFETFDQKTCEHLTNCRQPHLLTLTTHDGRGPNYQIQTCTICS